MQREPRRLVQSAQRAVLGLVAAMLWVAAATAAGGAEASREQFAMSAESSTSWFPPLERPPLAPPLRLTGSFGEGRSTHFHAGLDLSTDERVGAPVVAPLAGRIVRVRTSGVGYGRSLYLETHDGRLLVFGHLDAFDEPLASYVDQVQDSTGEYEQDLWPDTARFPVTVGQRLGWSGRSGTGPPHLHFEIRRVDMALNPLLAGARVEDHVRPRILGVTFEPLDDRSSVAGGSAPFTVRAPGTADSASRSSRGTDGALVARVTARGKLRVIVEALDERANGRLSMAPWSVAMNWRGERVECRFDSVSWADGMSEVDWVYDRGRATNAPSSAIALWAPPGFRPRVMHTSAPLDREAGTLSIDPSDPERTITFTARDVAGNEARWAVVVAPEPAPAPQDSAAIGELLAPMRHLFPTTRPDWGDLEMGDFSPPLSSATMLTSDDLHFGSLPGGHLRVEVVGSRWKPHHPQAMAFVGDHALRENGGRIAVLVTPPRLPYEEILRLVGGGARRWSARTRTLRLSTATNGGRDGIPGFRWWIPDGALFEPATWVATTALLRPRNGELAPVSTMFDLEPQDQALRSSITVEIDIPARQSLAKLGLYREGGDGWEFVRARIDSASRRVSAETRRLGRFALFRDHGAPRIVKRAPARRAPQGDYPRWALEARLADDGSGIDARVSRLEVDGRVVPSEWDAEERTLRWRPLRAPSPGSHRYRVIATDRTGNASRADGVFVLD